MKVNINEDGWYPVLTIEEGQGFDIPESLYDRYKLAELEWDTVQEELAEFYEGN